MFLGGFVVGVMLKDASLVRNSVVDCWVVESVL